MTDARTTDAQPIIETLLYGDTDLAQQLAGAMDVEGRSDRLTHGFHTYPARLHPDTARDLLGLFPGDSVLDPFCGGGTIAVEAVAAGRRFVGSDLSPIAVLVARARTSRISPELTTKFRSTARKMVERARKSNSLPHPEKFRALEQWYAPCAMHELQGLWEGIEQAQEDIRPLLRAAFSSIVIKVSWRKSDTSSQRERHRRPPGTTAILFHKKVRELGRRIEALREVIPDQTPPSHISLTDARVCKSDTLVDLVLTSPPYPAVYDYVALQHLRMVWLELDKSGTHLEISSRAQWKDGEKDARKKWRQDTAAWIQAAQSNVKPGGHVVVVIGDGLSPSGLIDSGRVCEDAALEAGLTLRARASVERPDYARQTTRWEHVFAFGKS